MLGHPVKAAIELARRDHAELVGLAIEAHLPHYGATVGEVEEEREVEEQTCKILIAEAVALADAHGVALHGLICAGHPAQQIVQAAADQHADLIVVGHSGHSGVWGRFLGSTAEKVSRHAEASVLIVR
jgi:nucleotide-binding universal stress UspA family protein